MPMAVCLPDGKTVDVCPFSLVAGL